VTRTNPAKPQDRKLRRRRCAKLKRAAQARRATNSSKATPIGNCGIAPRSRRFLRHLPEIAKRGMTDCRLTRDRGGATTPALRGRRRAGA
jgi:hypothetical protein